MANEPILEVRDLTLNCGEKTLVEGLSFTLQTGRILAIVGPNGAGKSSLLKGILGLIAPSAGDVQVLGQSLLTRTALARAKIIAYVPQQSALNLDLTVKAVVEMGRFAHRQGSIRNQFGDGNVLEQAMQQCDVHHLAQRRFLSLSGGERGRVLIARALATEAPLLLLDEPTHSLDVPHVLDCLANLRRLADQGKTIVMVTHDLNQLLDFADEMLLMKGGRKLAGGTPETLLDQRVVVEGAFGVRLIPQVAFGYSRLTATEDFGRCAE